MERYPELLEKQGLSVKERATLIRLIQITKEVRDTIQAILNENQEVVLSILSQEVVWPQTCVQFTRLYQRQQNRADFGFWLSYYESILKLNLSNEINEVLISMVEILQVLHQSFYEYKSSYELSNEDDIHLSKGWVLYELGLKKDTADLEFEPKFMRYIEHIRGSLESIGKCLGKLLVIQDTLD